MVLCTNFAIAADPWPRWQMMWLTAFAIYCGCKWLTLARADVCDVPFERKAAYLFTWPGLDANRILGRSIPSRPGWAEWALAISKLALGIVILYRITPSTAGIDVLIRGWVGLLGLAFVLHFGLFHVLSCLWRAVGVDARPLMEWPIAATSVGEFWGRRWNRAFRDLTHRFLFRPLIPRLGARGALLAGFLASGIVHDIVISLPAGGGYGGPTTFFLLQALGIAIERSEIGLALGLAQGFRGWLFTALVVIGPAPMLFHPPFVTRVIAPFLQALGAW